MTMTELPRRPYVELAPPVDGLAAVRAAARQRRRRRAAGAALGAAAAVVVAGIAFLPGGGSGVDVLRPVPPAVAPSPAPSGTAPAPVATDAPAVPPAGSAPAVTHSRRASASPDAPVAAVDPGVTTTGGDRMRSRSAVAAPAEMRVFRTQAPFDEKNLCPGSASAGKGTISSDGFGWCLTATATPVDSGVQLLMQACRDSTGGGTLTYDATREVNFVVKQDGRRVWSWGRDHPDSPGSHQRSARADECWNWQVVWPGVTRTGAAAGHGRFTLVATAYADELAGYPHQTVGFAY